MLKNGAKMKTSIKYKLFLAMLLATGAVVVCMFLIMKWSFHRGFLNYVNTLEKQHLVQLKTDLEEAYAENGSWDFLRLNPLEWKRILTVSHSEIREEHDFSDVQREPFRRAPPEMPPEIGKGAFPPGPFPPPPGVGRFESRVKLLDSQKNRICGNRDTSGNLPLHALVHQQKTIGYLSLIPPKAPPMPHQLRFVKERNMAMGLTALAMFLIAACLSLPIANQLVRPIRALVRATRELSSGNYQTRTDVSGQDELGQLARDFNTLAETLDENEKARRQWVADISHELRTPLAVLRGEIEAIQDGIRESNSENMAVLHSEVLRLTGLVNDLYELSMSDIGALSYQKTEVDPVQVLEQALESFHPRFEDKNIRIKTRFPLHPVEDLWADPQRLSQLYVNILENSFNYTDPGGCLEVRVDRDRDIISIDFLDSAPEVAEKDLPRLFDRLFRVESSRSRAHGGAGLGLSICRNIVEAHQGSVEAKSSPLGGLWIAVKLPLKASES